MHRYRIAVFVLLVLSVSFLRCASSKKGPDRPPFDRKTWVKQVPGNWVPKVDPKSLKILNLPFRVVTPRGVFISSFLSNCFRLMNEAATAATATTAPAASCPAALVCAEVHEVQLGVHPTRSTVDVKVDPTRPFQIEAGSCISWSVLKEDPADSTTPTIAVIDFIDSAEEASGKGKTGVSFTTLGDHCFNVERCVMYFGLIGNVTYTAIVNHGVYGPKKADPDVQVNCTGCGELTSGACK